jgi:hypothetical protein
VADNRSNIQPGVGAVTRANELLSNMPGSNNLPQDQQSRDKINTAVATNLVQNLFIKHDGTGSQNMAAAMGTGASSNNVYVMDNSKSEVPRVVATDIIAAQNTSINTLNANLTAAVNNAQQPAPTTQTTATPIVSQPGTEQPSTQVSRSH